MPRFVKLPIFFKVSDLGECFARDEWVDAEKIVNFFDSKDHDHWPNMSTIVLTTGGKLSVNLRAETLAEKLKDAQP